MDLTDEALIAKFRQTRDSTYFKSLVRRYQDRIFNAAFRILGDGEEAEEVVQETLIKMHQNLPTFQGKAAFGAWVFRIVHNQCIDAMRLRQRKRGSWLPFDPQASKDPDEKSETNQGTVSQLADPEPGPSQLLDFIEQEEVLVSCLNQLPDNQRAVLILHEIEGFQYHEIAEITGIPMGSVRSKIYYAKQKMRELLEPYFSQSSVSAKSR